MSDLADQDCSADLIKNFYGRMIKMPKDKRSVGWLKTNLDSLEQLWNEFHERHRVICRDPANKDSDYVKNDIYGETQSEYVQTKSSILNGISPGRNQSTVQADRDLSDITLDVPTRHHSPLEPMKLPKFSGNRLEWETFRGMFESLVHNVPSIPPILKLQYLLGSLTGEAAQSLKNTKVTAGNYDGAWSALVRRYDNKRVLVAAHLDNMIACPPATKKSISEINRIYDVILDSRLALQNLGCPTDQWDTWFIHLVVYKLDESTREQWGKSLGQAAELPTFNQLSEFIENTTEALETAQASAVNLKKATGSSNITKDSTPKTTRAHVASQDSSRKKKNSGGCILCSEHHFVTSCERYKAMGPTQGRTLLSSHKLCENCLRKNHSTSDCRASGRCFLCNDKHHTSLHADGEVSRPLDLDNRKEVERAPSTVNKLPDDKDQQTAVKRVHTSTVHQQVLLATAIIQLENEHGDQVIARALLDQGAEFSFVTERIAQCLSLPKKEVNIPILGVGGAAPGVARQLVPITLRSPRNLNFHLKMEALILRKLTPLLPSSKLQEVTWEHIEGLQLADPDFGTPARVDCIIGAEIYGQLLTGKIRHGRPGEPTAQETVFGWILSGFTSNQQPQHVSTVRTFHSRADQSLRDALRAFWEIEELPKHLIRSPDDLRCEEHFESTYSRNEQGRFIVRLPLLTDPPDLGDSKSIATARWLQTEAKLKRNPELARLYTAFMLEYLSLGHMEIIEDAELVPQRAYYIPHHGVLKGQGSEKKIRVVFNASQGTSNGKSLNDHLPAGPKLQEDLWVIIVRWRFFFAVFVADIIKMFRQFLVDGRDTDLLRIIWRQSPDDKLLKIRLLTVTYGTTSAPYQAVRSLLQLARTYKDSHPRAARLIQKNKYIDDFLAGADTVEEAKELLEELVSLLGEAGVSLGKWASNDRSLLPASNQSQSIPLETKIDESVSTLGLRWLPPSDEFCFKVDKIKIAACITKRTILAEIARLFDPLGWLGPVVIRAKILMQQLWISGVAWDEPVCEDTKLAWIRFVEELSSLEDIRIPRWLGSFSRSRLQLHGFSDASERAYAASVYLVVDHGTSRISSLIMAKTKVAPIKTLSMPRLELCGAHLLANLIKEFLGAIDGAEVDVMCWTDAKIVLSWLADHPSRWTTFVATRISSILTLLPGVSWQHVKSEENPADLATRGLTPIELRDSSLWWKVPPWLSSGTIPETSVGVKAASELPEQRPTHKFTFVSEKIQEEPIDRFSSYQRLVRVLCYCRRFIAKARKLTVHPQASWIKSEELQQCQSTLVKITQARWFPDELAAIRRDRRVHRSSPLLQLNPFLGEDGVLRVGGRLTNALLPYTEKHPAILPKHSLITQLLITHAHHQTLHGGPLLTHGYLRRSYWIVRGKSAIYATIKQCVRCARFAAKPERQQMGNLPLARVISARPFQRAGVDYAGPLKIRVSPGRGNKSYKGYVCIFVCMSVKAVHIEIVSDYTSAAFIAAFRRFVSRRGHCAELFSDNGTNFHGAKGKLQRLFQEATMRRDVAEYLENDGTSWKFIPPASPHWGGLWEAAVKSAKYHLHRVIGDATLTYEELATLTAQIEACMNSRPLCLISADSQDYSPLTPGHFLTGSALMAPREPDLELTATGSLRSRWLLISAMKTEFWRRWRTEYLQSLQQRTKWTDPVDNVRPGDVVLLMDTNLPPTKWALARVQECHVGPDGHVRVVTLRTATTTLTRPVTKICRLPVQHSEDCEKTKV